MRLTSLFGFLERQIRHILRRDKSDFGESAAIDQSPQYTIFLLSRVLVLSVCKAR